MSAPHLLHETHTHLQPHTCGVPITTLHVHPRSPLYVHQKHNAALTPLPPSQPLSRNHPRCTVQIARIRPRPPPYQQACIPVGGLPRASKVPCVTVSSIRVVGAPVPALTLIRRQRLPLLFGHLGVSGPPALLPWGLRPLKPDSTYPPSEHGGPSAARTRSKGELDLGTTKCSTPPQNASCVLISDAPFSLWCVTGVNLRRHQRAAPAFVHPLFPNRH